MNKPRRKKLLEQDLESLLAKYDRRILKLAEQAYLVRQQLEILKQINQKNGGLNAVRFTGGTEEVGEPNGADTLGGEPELLVNQAVDSLLAEQPEELPSN